MHGLTNDPPVRFIWLLARRYLRHSVGIQSAALAFYLLFAVFPFLIFISALLGLLSLDVAAILRQLETLLPREVVDLIGMYLTHVAAHPSPRLLLFGLVFSIWFPMRASNALMRAVRTAYHLGPPRQALVHAAKTLLYTVTLILTITLTLSLLTAGSRLIAWGAEGLRLPSQAAELCRQLRFPLAAAAGFAALFFLYALAQDRRRPWQEIWPGALAALAAWMVLSWLYSWYVDQIAQYSLLYGSIGAVIVLLIWLYLSATVLIMGAEVNAVLLSLKRDRASQPEQDR